MYYRALKMSGLPVPRNHSLRVHASNYFGRGRGRVGGLSGGFLSSAIVFHPLSTLKSNYNIVQITLPCQWIAFVIFTNTLK